jgi:hypothetical protein
MSCELCKGGMDESYKSMRLEAINYSKINKKVVVVYCNEKAEIKYMEAEAFFATPEGQVIELISVV